MKQEKRKTFPFAQSIYKKKSSMDDEETIIALSYIILRKRNRKKSLNKTKKKITMGDPNFTRKGNKGSLPYFGSRNGFRRSGIIFQVSIFINIFL